ncbi:MAG: hypothetical protein ACO3EZ_00025 [Prochlorotrichaceae cyanobacterium]
MNAQSPEAQPDTPQTSSPVKGLRLPEPDPENITVLLHNLPKDPVLPWNRYDSPWQPEDELNGAVSEDHEAEADQTLELEVTDPETIAPEEVAPAQEELAQEEPMPANSEHSLGEETAPVTETTAKTFEPGFVNLTVETSPVAEEEEPEDVEDPEDSESHDPEAESATPPADADDDLLSQLG